MFDHYYAVIMAGGGGTRLWPLSRKQNPKQLLSLFDDSSLFQVSVRRLNGLFPPERIFVVTVQDQVDALREHCPEIPAQNFLIEPLPRGTASVVGLAALALHQVDPDAVMSILTSDHYIGNEAGFRDLLRVAYDVALDGYLVTLGIRPTYPSTGYGYIHHGEMIGDYQGQPVYNVISFKEKPDETTAEKMLAEGNHLWNSGMFFWQVKRILKEFKNQMPDLMSKLEIIKQSWDTPKKNQVLSNTWPKIQIETIDYGIMEGAGKVAMLPADNLEWSDVGSWDSLFDLLNRDENGNIFIDTDHIEMNTHNSLVYSEKSNRLIVSIGVENLILVDTGDVLLVCDKDHAQVVRQVVDKLKDENSSLL